MYLSVYLCIYLSIHTFFPFALFELNRIFPRRYYNILFQWKYKDSQTISSFCWVSEREREREREGERGVERERERHAHQLVVRVIHFTLFPYLDAANIGTLSKCHYEVYKLKKKDGRKHLWGPSSLFLSNSGFHLFHLLFHPLHHLYPQRPFRPAIEGLNYVCRKWGRRSYQRSHKSQRDFWKKKMAKKGRNEWKTKQPRLLQFHFFNLFFFPPKKLDARA